MTTFVKLRRPVSGQDWDRISTYLTLYSSEVYLTAEERVSMVTEEIPAPRQYWMSSHTEMLMITRYGEDVGIIAWEANNNVAVIRRLFIDPDYRGLNCAKAALHKLMIYVAELKGTGLAIKLLNPDAKLIEYLIRAGLGQVSYMPSDGPLPAIATLECQFIESPISCEERECVMREVQLDHERKMLLQHEKGGYGVSEEDEQEIAEEIHRVETKNGLEILGQHIEVQQAAGLGSIV